MRRIASEFEYLKYFFENANISSKDRVILEEDFELCNNCLVPESLKLNLKKDKEYMDSRTTIPVINPIILDFDDLEEKLPGPPNLPKLSLLEKILLDKTAGEDYVVVGKSSGEHISLSVIIDELKKLTGIE